MRTSLTRLSTIEQFLDGSMLPENKIVFEASVLLDSDIIPDIEAQEKAYDIIRVCSRQMLKAELDLIHHKLMESPKNKSFRERIYKIFQTS